MEIKLKQVSPIDKVLKDSLVYKEVNSKKAVRGERIEYQIVLSAPKVCYANISIDSPLKEYVKVYSVKDIFVETPFTDPRAESDNGYITKTPAAIPDVLRPIEEQGNCITVGKKNTTLFVKVDVPYGIKAGPYKVSVNFDICPTYLSNEMQEARTAVFVVDVIDEALDEQKIIYTRWFYADCIANYHRTKMYSKEHWHFIEKYIKAAVDMGINMILVPVHTPPLDTEVGTYRPSSQLVDIEKKGDKYIFGFEKLDKFVEICRKCGVKYYEIAHMFSQWGAKFAANIEVSVNGKKEYMFGWGVSATDERYIDFLKQYVPAIQDRMKALGVADTTYYHVSDEPNLDNIDSYKTAHDIFAENLGTSKTFDALSHIEFCDEGLVDCPVTGVEKIHDFLPKKIENQWVYYCCWPQVGYINSFTAQYAYRTRALGILMYKYDIKGFLHWGFNFFNAALSKYTLDPYLNSSPDGVYPTGDGNIVYPGVDSVYGSIRGEIMYQALEDIRVCRMFEKYIGREGVIKFIDEAANKDIRFDDYPESNDFFEKLIQDMLIEIENYVRGWKKLPQQ